MYVRNPHQVPYRFGAIRNSNPENLILNPALGAWGLGFKQDTPRVVDSECPESIRYLQFPKANQFSDANLGYIYEVVTRQSRTYRINSRNWQKATAGSKVWQFHFLAVNNMYEIVEHI